MIDVLRVTAKDPKNAELAVVLEAEVNELLSAYWDELALYSGRMILAESFYGAESPQYQEAAEAFTEFGKRVAREIEDKLNGRDNQLDS